MELWPGVYKDLGFISYSTKKKSQVPSPLRLTALVYEDEKEKSEPEPQSSASASGSGIDALLQGRKLADYVDSWPLSSLDIERRQ